MATAPYETTFRKDGDLCFYAPVPALAHIGARYAELSDASFHFTAPAAEQEKWQQLTQRIGAVLEMANQGAKLTWPELEKQLGRDFPEEFQQAQQRVARPVHEYFQSGQMPLPEYLEWMLLGAEQAWALYGGNVSGLDMDALAARTQRLTKRLQESGYETAADRQMRSEDPGRYQFMAESLGQLFNAMDDPDPKAHEKMMAQQMELYRQSPLFEEAQKQEEHTLRQLESLRESHPDLHNQQVEAMEQLKRFMADPSAVMAEMAARYTLPEGESGSNEKDEADAESAPACPPGHILFNCGKRKAISKDQIKVFQQFLAQQDQLRPGIETALRDLHKWMHPGKPFTWPGDRVLFPDDADTSDVPLQCFQIENVDLDGKSGLITLRLDSLFGHFDEHGCYVTIRDGAVEKYGTWDDVFGDEDD